MTFVGRSQARAGRARPGTRERPGKRPGAGPGFESPPPAASASAILFGRGRRLGGRLRRLRRGIGGPEVPIAGRAFPELLRLPRILGAGIPQLHRLAASLATNGDIGVVHGPNCSVPAAGVAILGTLRVKSAPGIRSLGEPVRRLDRADGRGRGVPACMRGFREGPGAGPGTLCDPVSGDDRVIVRRCCSLRLSRQRPVSARRRSTAQPAPRSGAGGARAAGRGLPTRRKRPTRQPAS